MPAPTTSLTTKDRTAWTVTPLRYLHQEDSSIKTWDYAYHNGRSSDGDTLFDTIYTTFQVVVSSILSHVVVLRALSLIFFGCCSNVYTLESLLTLSPDTGTLITAFQFSLIALYKLPSQLTFTTVSPPEPAPLQPTQTHLLPRLRKRKIPISQWLLYASQFVVINTLNNAAFAYKISLPLHIILRSAGPVASMLVGWIWTNKSYSRRKIAAVALLSIGVVLAALSDSSGTSQSQSTIKHNNGTLVAREQSIMAEVSSSKDTTPSPQMPGFALLSLALVLSAIMGIWCDKLYGKYGRGPAVADEQLFYGHLLALPFFLAQWTGLKAQYLSLAYSAMSKYSLSDSSPIRVLALCRKALSGFPLTQLSYIYCDLPQSVPLLLANAATQVACISGVHHLSTQTSALTVSIVLNIRKLMSLLLSIWIFGNQLVPGVAIGAVLVFVGGGLYGLPETKPDARAGSTQVASKGAKKIQ